MKLTIWCIFCCVALCFCKSVLFDNLGHFSEDNDMKECASKVIASDKSNHSLIISMMAVDDAVAQTFYQIENNTFISRNQNWYNDTLPTDVHVVMSKDVDDLKNKINVLRNDYYWNPRDKIVMIFENSFFKNELVIFLRKYNIINVTIIVKSLNERHKIHAFGPELDKCNKPLQIEFIGYCSEMGINYFFPVTKAQKLNKCRVKFTTHTYLPYTGTLQNGLKGVDDYILDTIHRTLGITFELVRHRLNEDFGKPMSNGTFSGLLRSVSKHDVEGAVGGLQITYERVPVCDFIYPHGINHLKVVIANTDLLGTWETVLHQLNFATLILIFTLFVIFSTATTTLLIFPVSPNKRDITRNCLIVWGYFLNNMNVRIISPRLSHRIIVIDMLAFTILMYSVIQASLSSATTKPTREYQATDVNEIMKSYYAITRTNCKALNVPETKTCKTLRECVTEVKNSKSTNKPLYTIIPETYYHYYKWHLLDNKGYFEIHDLRESVGIVYQSLCFVKGSSILPAIDTVIESMVSSYLIEHYLEIIEYSERLEHFYSRPHQPLRKYDVYEISKAFNILICGLSISLIIFIIEVLSYKHKVIQRNPRYHTNR